MSPTANMLGSSVRNLLGSLTPICPFYVRSDLYVYRPCDGSVYEFPCQCPQFPLQLKIRNLLSEKQEEKLEGEGTWDN
jgi:hypothetical protein